MLIKRNVLNHGNLYPSALNAIAGIPESWVFHAQHGHRHPRSAYETSLRLVASQWLKTLDAIDRLRNEYLWLGKDEHLSEATAAYTQLLHRINEHFDACYSVLRSLCPATRTSSSPIDTQFLDKANPPGWKKFREATREYRENHIGLIVNTLKHKQGELCPVYFRSNLEFRPGYFLCDVLPDGALGPSAKLHNGGNTAFSFSRDMLIHLCWLYRIGNLLSDTIKTTLQATYGHTHVEQSQITDSPDWCAVLERCAQLKPEFFPDELEKPYPRILYQAQPQSVTLEFPTTVRGLRFGSELRISTQFSVDSMHRQFKLPYFSKQS